MKELKKISESELKKILEEHKRTLKDRISGEIKTKTNLRNVDLIGVDLSGAYLENVDLRGADLRGANLRRANLAHADLTRANLSGADLTGADLAFAKLIRANLSSADLYRANLHYTDFCYANLSGASLNHTISQDVRFIHTNLKDAELCWAYLSYAIFENANLKNTNLFESNLVSARFINTSLDKIHTLNYAILQDAELPKQDETRKGIILKEDLKGFKKCQNDKIVELLIPKGSIVFSINKKMCRSNKAKVINITNIKGTKTFEKAKSFYLDETTGKHFCYKIEATIEIDDFDLAYNIEDTTGIHFFRTRKEAENYGKTPRKRKTEDIEDDLWERFSL